MRCCTDWLKWEQVPGITGVDTRELTKVLREHGVMMGKIVFDDEPETFPTDWQKWHSFLVRKL